MAKLYYQGHASFRLTTNNGVVAYIDPYVGDGYDVPADLILSTHNHGDHSKVELPARKDDCIVIRSEDALKGGVHNNFDIKGIHIQAVQAYNDIHKVDECVGYVVTVDGVSFYMPGDTGMTEDMQTTLPAMKLDYAFIGCDGQYNMGPEEAAECARAIKAKHSVPIHTTIGKLFDREQAERFIVDNRIIIEPGETLEL